MTEIPTGNGKLYLASVIDLYSRRLLGAATGPHSDADLACAAIKMAVASRGGVDAVNEPGWREDESKRVIFHTDRDSTYTANAFTKLCRNLGVRPSMGRVGSCFDNSAAEAFFSSLEWEVLSRHAFATTRQAKAVVLEWCYGFYNHQRRHSSAGMMSPVNYENTTPPGTPHRETLHDLGGTTGVEFPHEERRRGLQNCHVLAEATVLGLEAPDLLGLLGGHPGTLAGVDLGLDHPLSVTGRIRGNDATPRVGGGRRG